MTHPSRQPLFALALVALAVAATGGAAVLHSGSESSAKKTELKLHLRTESGADAIEIDDLESLAVGESRDYATASGKPVTVTRDDDGYALELDGKTIRIGGEYDLHGSGHQAMKMRHIEINGDGDAQKIVLSGEPHEKHIIIRRGADGAGGFAFTTDERGPHTMMLGHGLLDRIEKSEKFLALDDVTREIVREIVRDASGPLVWIDEYGAEGETGESDDKAVQIWIERHAPGDNDEQ